MNGGGSSGGGGGHDGGGGQIKGEKKGGEGDFYGMGPHGGGGALGGGSQTDIFGAENGPPLGPLQIPNFEAVFSPRRPDAVGSVGVLAHPLQPPPRKHLRLGGGQREKGGGVSMGGVNFGGGAKIEVGMGGMK